MALNDFLQRLQGITNEGSRETDFRVMQSQRAKQYKEALDRIRQQAQRNIQFNAYAIPGEENGEQNPGGVTHSGKFMYPLKGNNRISSNYGPRKHPVHGKHSNHTGIDWAAKSGTPIYAPGSGTIRSAKFDKIYGNQTVLDLGGGRSMMFGHQSGFAIKPGQQVLAGQLLGYVGSTGWSTGPHLHFETWQNNRPVNPLSWFM